MLSIRLLLQFYDSVLLTYVQFERRRDVDSPLLDAVLNERTKRTAFPRDPPKSKRFSAMPLRRKLRGPWTCSPALRVAPRRIVRGKRRACLCCRRVNCAHDREPQLFALH